MRKLLTLALAMSLGVAVQAEELFVKLNSASPMTQGEAMVLANTALEQQADVRILLCDAGGDLALAEQDAAKQTVLKPRDVTPHQLLQGAIKAGAQVEVCALYLPNSAHGKEDLIEGVQVGMPAEIAGQMLDPRMRTFTF